ncbi:hypothetical protein INT44_006940 [Umbelopsis vinacea]|uniref:Uncharacterized protein n=1 Tax=Umbelopsis vinacea TaxID=44442 RepID=A0A8H7PK19_9FUNG|nr:hypothetical protein INT44_006940 [Umbelopsis vinacea]
MAQSNDTTTDDTTPTTATDTSTATPSTFSGDSTCVYSNPVFWPTTLDLPPVLEIPARESPDQHGTTIVCRLSMTPMEVGLFVYVDDGESQCYPYRNNTPFAWPNLACDPNLCFVISANGSPAPSPSIIPNITSTVDPGATATPSSSSPDTGDNFISTGSSKVSVTTIALIAVSSLLFLLGLAWLTRIITKCRLCPTPFFQRRDEQSPVVATTDLSSHHPDNQSTTSSNLTEPLPVYVPPDAPPPKYENAIVNQIRETRVYPVVDESTWVDGLERGEANESSSTSEMRQVNSPSRPLFSWR